MTRRKLILLASIFLILLFAAGLPSVMSIVDRYNAPKPHSELPFALFNPDKTQKVLINFDTQELNLVKEGQQWKIASYPASLSAVDNLFKSFKEVKVGELVSKNSASHPQFGLATSSATRLTLIGTNTEKSFEIGNTGPVPSSFYVKAFAADNVYLVTGSLKDYLFLSVKDWRDKTIVQIPTDGIYRIEVTGKTNLTLGKTGENKWELILKSDKKPVADSSMSAALANFTNLEADEFLTETEAQELTKTSAKTNLKMLDQAGNILLDLAVLEHDSYYFVEIKNKTETYKLSNYKLDPIFNFSDQTK